MDIDENSLASTPRSSSPPQSTINLQPRAPMDPTAADDVGVDPSPLIAEEERAYGGDADGDPSRKSSDDDEGGGGGDDDSPPPSVRAPRSPTWRQPVSSTRTFFVELSSFFSW